MLVADYLRRQAEACSQLSRATIDLGIAGRLRAMADEFRRKAAEIERGGCATSETDAPRGRDNGANRK
jgi:hypothetical protein